MIIHIGTQKTGSKAIQHFLTSDLATSTGGMLCFPESGREGVWHEPLYHDLVRGVTGRLEMVCREVAASGAREGVLSCEAFYRLPEDRIRLLHEIVGISTIVVFVRRQDQLINSLYNQLIKAHRVSFDQILKFEQMVDDYLPEFDHMVTVDRWGRVFGHDRIIPIIYHKQGSAVDRFMEHLHQSMDIDWLPARMTNASVNPNPALDLRGLKILRRVKQLCPRDEDLPRLTNAAHSVLRDLFIDTYENGDQYVFPTYKRQAIVECYRDSNECLRARYFPEHDSLFSPVTVDPFVQALEQESELADFASTMGVLDEKSISVVQQIYREADIAYDQTLTRTSASRPTMSSASRALSKCT